MSSLSTIQHLNTKRVVLASASPRRRQILIQLGLKFEIVPSTFPEQLEKSSFQTPSDYVLATATEKTKEVVAKLTGSATPPDLVIGADTIVVAPDNTILEKPTSKDDAVDTLKKLRGGRNHRVLTAVVIAYLDKSRSGFLYDSFVEETIVTFGPVGDEIIEAYVETGDPMDKAGSYGYQSLAGVLVESIQGCFYNVVGFPLYRVHANLVKHVQDGRI
ncbi:hypothetical protein SeMB42_g01505 [Synchytrium endobioticum]|uniref:Septum formation protein Maf n=1 Tax=Synchytrium endobioticum TaxID=286115 RepID=A0A507DL10_9FUNG|nr:hypothetical protein SeLEV6574_g01980 [Synchytrium endobioticum]TPX52313.1 hypothetical protein SeMB42_g01505 [Synchytrium endobioticum]